MNYNVTLLEAVEEKINGSVTAISEIKKKLNTCALTKYKSAKECLDLYNMIFNNSLENEITVSDWGIVYNTLFNDTTFISKFSDYIVMWQPARTDGMFSHLVKLIESELKEINQDKNPKKAKIFLSEAKTVFSLLNMKFESISNAVHNAAVRDSKITEFLTVIRQVLTNYMFYMDKLMSYIKEDGDNDELAYFVHIPLTEDAQELLNMIEKQLNYYNKTDPINEGIVNKVKEAALEAKVKNQKLERAFNDTITKKVNEMRTKRRQEKHAEMVGESLAINRRIKRFLKVAPVALISPITSAILYCTGTVIDRKTDKRDRDILINQLKDELEIIEEKIAVADRAGDDKGKIELIRLRQKLSHEYERVTHIRFDPSRIGK